MRFVYVTRLRIQSKYLLWIGNELTSGLHRRLWKILHFQKPPGRHLSLGLSVHGCGDVRVCYGTRQLQPPRHLVLALIRADGAPLRSVFLERVRQVSGSEDICHPFEVVGHHCKTIVGLAIVYVALDGVGTVRNFCPLTDCV